jgi:hypothetical protein
MAENDRYDRTDLFDARERDSREQTAGPQVSTPTGTVRQEGRARQTSASSGRPVRPIRRVRVPKARRMRLSVVKVDPWSVAKVSFMLSIAMGIIQVACVTILWWILSTVGVFDKVSSLVSSAGLSGKNGFDIMNFFGLSRVVSAVALFSIFEVVLIVILSVIGAFLYNVVSSLVGGVHVTLGDD